MLCEVAQLCECRGDVAVRSPQAAVQTCSSLALGVPCARRSNARRHNSALVALVSHGLLVYDDKPIA